MIFGNNVTLMFGDRALFDHLSFSWDASDKIGLIGRNGAGKSTLLKAIAGLLQLDEGSISIERGKRFAYLPQEVVLASERSILEEAYTAFAELAALSQEAAELEKIIEAGLSGDQAHEILDRYAVVQEGLANYDPESLKVEAKKVLQGLGFTPEKFDAPVTSLSVGWKMRLVLAKLLLSKADFYLFDEPTNHLDIVAKDWFVNFLKESKTGFVLVSHDRYFLDNVCDYMYELDRGQGKAYYGNYAAYETQKAQAKELIEKAYEQQQREIKQKMETIERFRAKASKAGMAQSMLKQLDKIERIEPVAKPPSVTLNFSHVQRSGKVVLVVKDLSKKFGDHTIFKNVSFEIPCGEKVALVAANGVGKSTLLNLICEKYPLETGSVSMGYNVHPALFEQDQDKVLNHKKTILEEAEDSCKTPTARQRVRGFLGAFLFPGDDVHKKIGVLSGGEKNRVAMVKVLLTDANFLILDEPTNHLDLDSKDILLRALKQFTGTILFVSHDRDFLNSLATTIIELTSNGARTYKGNYDEYLYRKQMNSGSQELAASKPVEKQEVKKTSQSTSTLNSKEAHELRKKISNIEKKISRLDADFNDLTEKLSFYAYGSDQYNRVLDQQRTIQEEKAKAERNWEELQAKLNG